MRANISGVIWEVGVKALTGGLLFHRHRIQTSREDHETGASDVMAACANLSRHDDTIESPIVQHIHSQNPIGIRDIMTPNGGPCQDAHFEVQTLAANLKVSHSFVRVHT